MILLLAEYTIRSILLGLLAWLALKLLRIRDLRVERAVWRIVLICALLMPVLLQLGALSPVRPPTTASYVELVSLTARTAVRGDKSSSDSGRGTLACRGLRRSASSRGVHERLSGV